MNILPMISTEQLPLSSIPSQGNTEIPQGESFELALKALLSGLDGQQETDSVSETSLPQLLSISDVEGLMSILSLLTPNELSELSELLTAYADGEEGASETLFQALDKLGIASIFKPVITEEETTKELSDEVIQLLAAMLYQNQEQNAQHNYIANSQEASQSISPISNNATTSSTQSATLSTQAMEMSNQAVFQVADQASAPQSEVQVDLPQFSVDTSLPKAESFQEGLPTDNFRQPTDSTQAQTVEIQAVSYTPSQAEQTNELIARLQSETALRPSIMVLGEAKQIALQAEKPIQAVERDTTLKAQMSVSAQPTISSDILTPEQTISPESVTAQVEGKIAERLQTLSTELSPKSEFTMLLEPESLGKITVKLTMEDSKLTINIVAENKLTQQLLAQRGDLLTDNLKLSSISVESYTVTSAQPSELATQLFGDPSLFSRQGRQNSNSASAQRTWAAAQPQQAANEPVSQAVRPTSAFLAYA